MSDLYSFDGNPFNPPHGVEMVISSCSSALSRSRLPGLDYALNPYRGCQHRCAYCYAPYLLGIPPSQWGRRVEVRANMPNLLAKELRRKSGVIGLGTVTDPYQPAETSSRITRKCLEVIARSSSSVSVHTKSDLVLRDLDLLSKIDGVEVGVTVTTHMDYMASIFEPIAPPPSRRLEAIRALVENGIETYALVGPMIPMVTDIDPAGFASSIRDTGVRRVMLDRLRIRPGMLENLLSRIGGRMDWDEFARLVRSAVQAADLENRMGKAFMKAGLRVEEAF